MTSLSLEEFLKLESMQQLTNLYSERGFQGDESDCYMKAQEEWHELAMNEAVKVEHKPEKLEPVVCERNGIRYEIYGVIHGLVGGDDREYKDFVNEGISKLDYVVFENGLNYFYPYEDGTTIPDFMVLGSLGSIALGFSVGFYFPSLIWEMVVELLKPKRAKSGVKAFDYNPRFHGIDPEIRRGVCDHPPLPSRLQVDFEMSAWNRHGLLAAFKDPFAIVPRSMFMAGFAEGDALSRGVKRVAVVVGDLHTMEIVRFLEDPHQDHPLYQAARSFAQRRGLSRFLAFFGAKFIHLMCAGTAGALVLACIVIPIMYFVF